MARRSRLLKGSRSILLVIALPLAASACTPLVEPRPLREPDPAADQPPEDPPIDEGPADSETNSSEAASPPQRDAATMRLDARVGSDAAMRASDSAQNGSDALAGDASGPMGTAPVVVPKKALGAACTSEGECETSHCVDGFCCVQAECGACLQCRASGSCEQVLNSSESDCNGTSTCGNRGQCALVAGQKCNRHDSCATDLCHDGVCCERACSGICSTCNSPGSAGRCGPADGDDDTCLGARSCTRGECATVDAQQLDASSIYGFGTGSVERRAQVVTITRAGTLLEVRLSARCSAGEPFSVTIEDVAPDGRPTGLAISNVFNPTSPRIPQFPNGELTGHRVLAPFQVAAGEQIAIVVAARSSNATCTLSGSPSDVYAGGHGYVVMGGVAAQSGHDYMFQTLIK